MLAVLICGRAMGEAVLVECAIVFRFLFFVPGQELCFPRAAACIAMIYEHRLAGKKFYIIG